ncbi:MAG: hypothetical protein SPL13_02690 [Clostridia bacterium]|nr:hypothetical protein [Clostridia bacterium]
MNGLWGKNLSGEMNVSLAFTLKLNSQTSGKIRICGADCFKVYSDDKLIYFGPSRAAHGYARVAEIGFTGERLTVVVQSNYVYQFCWIKQQPFFACEVTVGDKTYTAEDFTCYRITDRLQKVQRYSFQRGFSEIYRESEDFNSFLAGKEIFPKIETESVKIPELLPTYNQNPLLNPHAAKSVIEKGGVIINPEAEVWRDRVHYIDGEKIQGYKIEEWEDSATDDASKFVFVPNGEGTGTFNYANFDFGRGITGFFEAEVSVKKGAVLYLLFDEILWDEEGKGKYNVNFKRNDTSNVIKWTFENDGIYHISTFDPYTLRYAVLIYNDVDIKNFVVRDYENPQVNKFEFSCADKRVERIVKAARATLAQNSVDILTDCPQRERAGWLSDAWFSSLAERLFTGDNAAERTFLENYSLSSKRFLPDGMIPMC